MAQVWPAGDFDKSASSAAMGQSLPALQHNRT